MPAYRVNQGSWNFGGFTYGFGEKLVVEDERDVADYLAAGVLTSWDDPMPPPRVGDPYADLNHALHGNDVQILTRFVNNPPDRLALVSMLRATRISRRSAVLQQAIRSMIALYDLLEAPKAEQSNEHIQRVDHAGR